MIGKQGVGLLIGHNGVQDKTTLDPTNETVNKGVYDATLLSTVDPDLAVGNIKEAVNIFGVLGTLAAGALAQDILGSTNCPTTTPSSGVYQCSILVSAGGDTDLASNTQDYDATSLAVAATYYNGEASGASALKLGLYMDGVRVAESDYIPFNPGLGNISLMGTRALSGSTICKLSAHNYSGDSEDCRIGGFEEDTEAAAGILIGSVKLV